jgi:hypothetical protein
MDSTQIWTILITAVVSVVAKEVVQWLLSLAKKMSFPGKVMERVRPFLSRRFLAIVVDLLFIGALLLVLGVRFLSSEPATRQDVLIMGAILIGLAFMMFAFVVDLIKLAWHLHKIEESKPGEGEAK